MTEQNPVESWFQRQVNYSKNKKFQHKKGHGHNICFKSQFLGMRYSFRSLRDQLYGQMNVVLFSTVLTSIGKVSV